MPGRRKVWLGVGLAGIIVIAIVFGWQRSSEARLLRAAPDSIPADPGLYSFAVSRGATVFGAHCASCHGDRERGDTRQGVPDLRDQDWLYGTGKVSDIERVVAYGIRAHDPRGWNLAIMPALGTPVPGGEKGLKPLSPGDIDDVTDFLMMVEHRPFEQAAAQRGRAIYLGRGACYDCHGSDARGDSSIGAPNLADNIWIYGDGRRATIFQSIAKGRKGICPAWIRTLSPTAIREVALYVYWLSNSKGRAAARVP